MLNRAGQEGHAGPVTARRLWIDQPYVSAKSMLVHAVAEANRCQSVLSESLGFCTLIGEPADLEAVELLVTSLLVQANAAMLRYGQQADRRGASRTRSCGRAGQIGQHRGGHRADRSRQRVAPGAAIGARAGRGRV
jgi:hypothetical protein